MNSNKEPQPQHSGRSSRHDKVWQEPAMSKATRRPSLCSSSSVRGYLVHPRTGREIVYESTLERDLAYMLIADPSVRSFQEQPAPVSYIDDAGVRRSHTFDFRVELIDDSHHAVAVKPASRAERIERTLELIRDQSPRHADRIDLRTGDHITRKRAHDAKLITWALRQRNDDEVSALAALAEDLRGSTSIATFIASRPDEPAAFIAVLCLLADGTLRRAGTDRLTRSSLIESAVRR
ncbi:Tn7 transposase TnsA N-terminal domain-containing protein [Xanthobacteraceae bacterium A53D]